MSRLLIIFIKYLSNTFIQNTVKEKCFLYKQRKKAKKFLLVVENEPKGSKYSKSEKKTDELLIEH